MTTDPYRQEPEHPVDQLRKMIKLALEGLGPRADALPPSKLQDLAFALATLDKEGASKTPVDLLAALRELAPRAVPGLAILSSEVFSFTDPSYPEGRDRSIYPVGGRLFYPRALRIEVIGNLPISVSPEFEVRGADVFHPMIERCSIREFLEMTPVEGTVVSNVAPLKVRLWECPKAPEIRMIFRGDEQVSYPGGYVGLPFPGDPYPAPPGLRFHRFSQDPRFR